MAEPTQPPPEQHSPAPSEGLHGLLTTMADILDHDPDRPAHTAFTPGDRRALAHHVNGGPAPELLDITPRIVEPTTRGEYAARLRQIAGVR